MKTNTWRLASYAATGLSMITLAAFTGLATAQQSPTSMAMTNSGNVVMSGGVGLEARAEMAQREREANLKLVFTEPEGSYLSNINVKVLDRSGAVVLDTSTDGPWLLAKLSPGSYRVVASDGTSRREQVVNLGNGLQTLHIRMPSQGGLTGRPNS